MSNPENRYKVHVFSRLPMFAQTNDLTEARVIDEAAKLETTWSQAEDAEDHITYDESAIAFRSKLENKNSVLVLVEDRQTGDMVGFGEMTNEEKGPLFTLGYVLPEHRRRGILDTITKSICDAGILAGYEAITAEPVPEARRVLERNGFRNVGTGPNEIILKKELQGRTGEGPASPPGLPPRARR